MEQSPSSPSPSSLSSSSSTAVMSSMFEIIPTTVVRDCVCPYLRASDLLAIRATCVKAHEMLHKGDGSQEFWIRQVQQDFGVPKEDWRKTLQVQEQTSSANSCRAVRSSPSSQQVVEPLSIFGVDPKDAILESSSAFQSWKFWLKAKHRFYGSTDKTQQHNGHDEDTYADFDSQPFEATYFLRAAIIWQRFFEWLQSPEESGSMGERVLRHLKPGLSHAEWPELFRSHRHCRLHATQAVFAFCSGQQYAFGIGSSFLHAFDGLVGGYQAYGYYSCAKLVCAPVVDPGLGPIVIISDCFLSKQQGVHRKLYVDVDTGHLKFLSQHGMRSPIVASSSASGGAQDDVLKFLEYHTHRMVTGEIGISVMGNHQNDPFALTLFPRFAAGAIPAVTEGIQPVSRGVVRGVEIIGSAVYVPQGRDRLGYIYSIRIRLLTPEDGEGYQTPEQRGFQTCQLHTRHWKIADITTGQTNNVSGPGVIGMYPILRDGGYTEGGEDNDGTFQYQSCTGPMNDGSFSGFIEFVPGTIHNPTGEPFRTEVRPFALKSQPEFMY